MRSPFRGHGRPRRIPLWSAVLILSTAPAAAQSPPAPAPGADGVQEAGSHDELLRRLRQMEEANKQLLEQVKTLSQQYRELSEEVKRSSRERAGAGGDGEGRQERESQPGGAAGGAGEPSRARGPSGGGVRPRENEAQEIGNRRLGVIPTTSGYNYNRDGFQWETADRELSVRVRAELQADAMIYEQANQVPVHGGFYLPRTRFYLQGRVSRPIEYQLSFQRSYDNFAPLNVFVNFNYDPRLQFRIGRFKVPYLYEWYHLNNWRLIAPERSLFTNNFGPNRQIGVMGWGTLFDQRMEYAVGAFNGPRNSFLDFNDAKDVAALLLFRPFAQTDSFLKNLNFGGSLQSGYQDNAAFRPRVLRTNVNASTSELTALDQVVNAATIPFLAFNNDVRDVGQRRLWDLYLAYYYKGLSVLGAWDGGFESYAQSNRANFPIRLPISGYYAQAAYILTGETITDRTVIDPIRRFDLRRGRFGLGAWEVHARYSELGLGSQVFTYGLADPNLWTNRVRMTDVGLNWYLNKWTKIYLDWEHAMFAQPVYYAPSRWQVTSDLFWFRFQVYF